MDKRADYTIGIKSEGLDNLTKVIAELDKAGVETSEFKREAALLQQQLAEMQRQQQLIDSFVAIKKETAAAGSAFDAAQLKAQQLGRELAATEAPTKKQTAEFARARDAVNSTKDAYQAVQLRLQAMRGTLAENNIETTGLAQKQALLRNGVRDVEASITSATARFKEFGSSASSALIGTAVVTDRAAVSTKGYQGSLTQVAQATTAATESTKGFGARLGETAVAATAAAAAFFGIRLFAGSVQSSAEFEAALSRVRAATDATASEMALLKKAAEDSGTNSTQAAQALENLAKAGLSAKDAIAALPPALSLAQAGDIALGQSAEYVTKAVMGMGMSFDQAGRVADVLAMGANASNTSVKGLAEALSYAAPIAHSLGLSLESTVAIIGKFADSGIDASRAGTALNAMLSQFADPASQFRKELGAAGIVTNNFEKALGELAASGTRGERAILAVGQEAGPALRALLGQGIGALNDLKQKLVESEGSAAKTAAVMKDNLQGAMTGLANTWDSVKNALGTPVLPVLKDAVDQVTKSLRSAVSDGTVAKFGEAMATAFQAGIKWARDFVGQVDFQKVGTEMRAFADRANEVFDQIGEYATTAGNSVKLAYGVMSAGVNAVLVGIYGIGSVFAEIASKVMEGVAKLRDGLATVTFGKLSESFKLAAEDARNAAEGFGDAAQAMRNRAAAAMQDMADGAQLAQDGFEGLARTTQRVASVSAQADADIKAMAESIESAAKKAQEAAPKHVQAAEVAAVAVKALRAEYEAAVSTGNWQLAADKLQQVANAYKSIGDSAQEAAARTDAAYTGLGLTTTTELKRLGEQGKAAYDQLKASGTESAQRLGEAFKIAAERAIAANNGIAPAWVTAQAGVRGFKVETDEAGRSIIRSMQDAASAVGEVGGAAGRAAGGFQNMAERAAAAAEQTQRLQSIYDRHRLTAPGGDGAPGGAGGPGQKKSELAKLYDRNQMGEFKSTVGKSGDVREAAVMETDINQAIVKRYGEEMLDNPLAKKAWQLRLQLESYQKNYGAGRSKQSLDQQRNIAAELARVEAEIEEARQAQEKKSQTASGGTRQKSSGGGLFSGPTTAAPAAAPAPVAPGVSAGPTTTFVSNITLPNGRQETVRYPDADSQATNERLLKALAVGKGVYQ